MMMIAYTLVCGMSQKGGGARGVWNTGRNRDREEACVRKTLDVSHELYVV
jgi:hypothetical protein